jgi:hypothetical protein
MAHEEPHNPAAAYHELLLKTSQTGMAALVLLCLVEAIAYSPWFAERAPFGLPLEYAGPTLWMCLTGWLIGAAWSMWTLLRGRGDGAIVVACLCTGFAAGTWFVWVLNALQPGPASRDYVGATLYTVLAALLFTGRTLARGMLVLSGTLRSETEG